MSKNFSNIKGLSDPSYYLMVTRTSVGEGHTVPFGFMGGATVCEDLGGLKSLGTTTSYKLILLVLCAGFVYSYSKLGNGISST